MAHAIGTVILCCLFLQIQGARNVDDIIQQIDEFIDEYLNCFGIPGMSLAIVSICNVYCKVLCHRNGFSFIKYISRESILFLNNITE